MIAPGTLVLSLRDCKLLTVSHVSDGLIQFKERPRCWWLEGNKRFLPLGLVVTGNGVVVPTGGC